MIHTKRLSLKHFTGSDQEIHDMLKTGCQIQLYRMGKIVVSAAGDLTSHTTTDGYIVVNKLKTTNGTITLEVPQNSVGVSPVVPRSRNKKGRPFVLCRQGRRKGLSMI